MSIRFIWGVDYFLCFKGISLCFQLSAVWLWCISVYFFLRFSYLEFNEFLICIGSCFIRSRKFSVIMSFLYLFFFWDFIMYVLLHLMVSYRSLSCSFFFNSFLFLLLTWDSLSCLTFKFVLFFPTCSNLMLKCLSKFFIFTYDFWSLGFAFFLCIIFIDVPLFLHILFSY